VKTLYFCYFGVREPLVQTQVLPYLRQLADSEIEVSLLTFEPELRERWSTEELAEQTAKLKSEGITWIYRKYHKKPSLLATAFDVVVGAWTAILLSSRDKIHVLHARSHVPMAMVLLARLFIQCRTIFDVRGLWAEEYVDIGAWKANSIPFRLIKKLEEIGLRKADQVVVLTSRMRDWLIANGLADEKNISVIPCCTDVTRFIFTQESQKDHERLEVIYAGTATGLHLMTEVVQFFRQLLLRRPDAFLRILTTSPATPLTGLLESSEVPRESFSISSASPDEIPSFLQRAHIGISFRKPSFAQIAASPAKIPEYLAAGLPVVTNPGIGDQDEILAKENAGVVVESFSDSAFEQTVERVLGLLREPDIRDRCHDVARKYFDLERIGGARYLEVYRRVGEPASGRRSILQAPTFRIVAFACLVQLAVTIGVFAAGRFGVTQMIDRNGCSTTLSFDCVGYLAEANAGADLLASGNWNQWLAKPTFLHSRFYSISLAVLRPIFGANTLSAFPVNLLSWLALLLLTFQLGKQIFDRRVAIVATVVTALWPSLLLHSTQLLKDTIFIVPLLLLIVVMVAWLKKRLSLLNGVVTGAVGSIAAFIINLTRSGFWGGIIAGLIVIGLGFLILRQIKEKRILPGNMLSACLLLIIAMMLIALAPEQFQENTPLTTTNRSAVRRSIITTIFGRADLAARRLSQIRHDFVAMYPNAGANFDAGVEFVSVAEVVRYLPRAAAIGSLAPFPTQWTERGATVGRLGRVMSGCEMSIFYVLEILALVAVWRSRKDLTVWMLLLVSVAGVTGLALAIINLGALYRMRYGFFILILLLGVRGWYYLTDKDDQRTNTKVLDFRVS
jgi:glycosyltransferase involved in cell wall biosynthesis